MSNIHVVYGYLVRHGGVGRYITEILKRIKNKNNVQVFTLENSLDLPPEVKVRLINCSRDTSFMSMNENEAFSRAVESIKSDDSFQHSHGIYSISPELYTAHVCLRAYFDKVKEIFGEVILHKEFRSALPLVDIEKRMLDSIASRNNQIVAVSRKVEEELARNYGIVVNQITPGASRFTGKPLSLESKIDVKRVGFIGNNIYTKGLIFLREALNALSRRGLEIECVSAGTSQDVDRFMGGSEFRYIPLGKTEVDESFYMQLNCFACPSIYEAYSLSTLEAMSLSVPVVSSRFNGVFSDAAMNGNPIVSEVDITNTKELSSAIERVLTDEEFTQKVTEQGRKMAEANSWKDTASLYNR
ncbi:MAG: glycosyltransferase family 4 protein, partial [Nanoarchaeota archaeon]|nr:glycosyltransferase family 4 protein [Nanoarchaeota archaeon]